MVTCSMRIALAGQNLAHLYIIYTRQVAYLVGTTSQ